LQLAVERALSTDPEHRFATLAPLLAELRRDPVARRRRTVTLALAVGTGGVFAVGVAELARPGTPATSPHCDEVARAADDVWTTERRQQVSDALRSTSLKFAADTADRVVLALDDLVLTWKAARRTACLDTAADSQEAQLEVARRLCLDRNLARQRDLVEALADPSTSMVRHVSGATEQVSRELSRCSDAAYLWQIAATAQSEPGQQTRAAALLGRARRHLDLGQLREGLAVLNEELTVDELARWPAPAVFEWGMIRAGLERGQGDFLRSRQTLEEAAHMTLGRAAPIAAADWQVDYGDILFELDALEQGDRAYARAEAFLNSRLGPDAIDTIVAAGARGHLPFARGDYGRALEIYEAAALVASRVAPETDGRRLELDRWTSETLARVGRLPESLQRTEDIVRRLRETRGDKHPSTLEALETLAGIELRAGHSDTALQHLYEVLEGLDASEGAQHSLARATTLANVGAALTQLERLDEATRAFEEARDALRRGGLQRDHAKMLAIDANLAAILNQQGRYQEALAVLEQVSEQMHAADTAKTTNGLMVRFNHAAALLHLARWAEAVAILESALGDAEIVGDSMVAGRIQLRLAQAYDRLGRGGDAERALMAAEGALADQPDEVLWVGELKAYRETRRFAARPR
jgi:tetratricopeptide (TPR) repeat protein